MAPTLAGRKSAHVQMLFLDTDNFTSMQEEWLEDRLRAGAESEYAVVVGHHPVYSGGTHGNVMEGTPLHEMLTRHKVSAYICGHDHNLQELQRAGEPTRHFVTGAGSKLRSVRLVPNTTVWMKSTNGAQFCRVDEASMRCHFFDEDGMALRESPPILPRDAGART